MQPIPSGTSSAPTKVLGKPGTTPKLVGVGGVHRVLNLDGSSNVELGNLEVTDNSDCVYNHSNAAAACTSSMPSVVTILPSEDMVGGNGDVSPAQAASQLIERLDALTLAQSGSFQHANGSALPW